MSTMQNTSNNQPAIIQYAINFGLIVGILWALKFLAFAQQDLWSPLIYIHYLLNVVTVVVLYIAYLKYRDSEPGKMQRRMWCIFFTIILCFFASLIECGTMFLFFERINPIYFSEKLEPALVGMINVFPYPDEMKEIYIGYIKDYGEVLHVISTFLGNIFFGGFMGLLFAFIIGNKKLS